MSIILNGNEYDSNHIGASCNLYCVWIVVYVRRKSPIEEMMESIEKIREKITDQEYIEMYNNLKRLFDIRETIDDKITTDFKEIMQKPSTPIGNHASVLVCKYTTDLWKKLQAFTQYNFSTDFANRYIYPEDIIKYRTLIMNRVILNISKKLETTNKIAVKFSDIFCSDTGINLDDIPMIITGIYENFSKIATITSTSDDCVVIAKKFP